MLAEHDSARLDAELLLAHCLGVDRAAIYREPERHVARAEGEHFQRLLNDRRAGRPVAQLVGRREFYSLELAVDDAVLTPRPETELLVELALDIAVAGNVQRVADLGTGSGAVALALAARAPALDIFASDISAAALKLARANAAAHDLDQIEFVHGSWLDPYAAASFDVIVSNPPYIASDDPLLDGELRFEPRLALDGGADGLAALLDVIAHAPHALTRGGQLLLEHGCDQAAPVRDALTRHGFVDIKSVRDLAGHERVTVGCSR